jgi:hypothetical protein
MPIGMPHVLNELIPRLPLPRPRGAIAFPGLCFNDLDKLGVVFRHPAIDIAEEGRVVPEFLGAGQPRRKRLAHPGAFRGQVCKYEILSLKIASPFVWSCWGRV